MLKIKDVKKKIVKQDQHLIIKEKKKENIVLNIKKKI